MRELKLPPDQLKEKIQIAIVEIRTAESRRIMQERNRQERTRLTQEENRKQKRN